MPQIVAAKYPVHFLNTWIMYAFYHVCTFIEATGLTHACWVLSYLIGKAAGVNVLHIPTGYNCLEATVFNAHPVVMPAEEKIVCGGTRGLGWPCPLTIFQAGVQRYKSPHTIFLHFYFSVINYSIFKIPCCSGVGAGVQGVQEHPQKFWFVKNPGKIPENSGTGISAPSNETELHISEFDFFFRNKLGVR